MNLHLYWKTIYLISGTKATTPFWKEPLPDQNDIRQKIQSKRENQLRQLQIIQDEIKAGHIQRPGRPPVLLPPSLLERGHGVLRNPGVHPYLNIHDPLNDSSGDQGNQSTNYHYLWRPEASIKKTIINSCFQAKIAQSRCLLFFINGGLKSSWIAVCRLPFSWRFLWHIWIIIRVFTPQAALKIGKI